MENRFFKMHEVSTRSDDEGNPIIEGYFVRYDDTYQVCEGATESVARGAFSESINGDVRALYNHNSDLVLGRTSAGTLELRDTDVGLWGVVHINPKDTQAMDAYARIARHDISGCSFGFDIAEEDCVVREDGTIHWTIKKADPLYEVSPCTFPAYEATSISARAKQKAEMEKRKLSAWKEQAKARLSKWH